MEFKFIELHEKLEKIDAMISNEGLLAIEEKKAKPRSKEMLRLYAMIDFLGFWAMTKRDQI